MSTAVIISGQMRTFARCYPTQRWQVYRHYHAPCSGPAHGRDVGCIPAGGTPATTVKEPEPHFFVSCCDDENAGSAELLRQHYANVHIEKWTDPTDLPEIPDELGYHAPYANATSHEKLMLQHWGNKHAWEFFQSTVEAAVPAAKSAGGPVLRGGATTVFDTIIRMRPDNLFHRFVPVSIPMRWWTYEPGICITPWWGKFGGINDRLAIMDPTAAKAYFNTYDRIQELLAADCPFHPESLVAASLQLAGIDSRTSLQAHFSTLRLNNDQRWPEIAAEDLAELIANS